MANIDIQRVMQILELHVDTVKPLLNKLNCGDLSGAEQLLIKFKLLVRKQRKILAKKYHPDIYKDDGERMKQVNNIVDLVIKGRIMLPQPQVVTVRYSSVYSYYGGVYGGYGHYSGSTTSATTS